MNPPDASAPTIADRDPPRTLEDDQHILAEVLEAIRGDLEALETVLHRISNPPAGYVRDLVTHVRGFGGKRLRPALVFLGGRAVDGDAVGETHARVAAVVELIHTATLVHDDILDGAFVRRMRPTLHRMEGEEVSVLLGDYLFASAYAEAAALEDPLASRFLSQVTRIVCTGEVLQIHERGNLDLPLERYLDIIEKKTAVLYSAACEVGARYADGTPEQVAALRDYGSGIGMAFQIVDDVLDLTGDEAVVGKSLGTDLARCKPTLPLIHFLRHGDPAAVEKVRAVLEAGRGGDEAAAIRDAVVSSGAVEYALAYARERVDTAVVALDVLPDTPARGILRRLADYVLVRAR